MNATPQPKDSDLILRQERWYIIILAAIQVAHILDFVIMMPLGPRFMRVFKIEAIEFSTLVSSYTFSAGLAGVFSAFFADHFERKKFLMINFAGFIVGTFLCALSGNFQMLLMARIIAGAFGGILNACVLSMVADLIPFHRRGRAMGTVMSAFSISSILGVPAGLYMANSYDSWNVAFYFICLISLIFFFLAWLILPQINMSDASVSFVSKLENFKRIISKTEHLEAFAFTSVLGFSIFSIVPFISPYMVKNVGLLESQLPLIYLIGGIGTILSARTIGILCDQIGNYKVFKTVALLSLFPIIGLTIIPTGSSLILAIGVTSLFTMFGSGRFIPAMTIVSTVVSQKERGTFMNLENSSRQLFSGIAAQVAGLMIGHTASGMLTGYFKVGIMAALATVLAIFISQKLRKRHQLN